MVLQVESMKEVSMRIRQGGPRVLIAERCYEEGQSGRRWMDWRGERRRNHVTGVRRRGVEMRKKSAP